MSSLWQVDVALGMVHGLRVGVVHKEGHAMSIDEQTQYHVDWWMRGANAAYAGRDELPHFPDDKARASFTAGFGQYRSAEQAERERLERCPTCDGCGMGAFNRPRLGFDACPDCHGTGRRP